MSRARDARWIGWLVAVLVLAAACGLDDGARVRNQDNVREGAVSLAPGIALAEDNL